MLCTPELLMVIKGVKHYAEIGRMTDPNTRQERFRYTLQRQHSSAVLYWGHEHTEEAAVEMANMYLNLMDHCVVSLRDKPGPRAQSVQFIAAPRLMQA
jgi:hypothetical protein